MEHKVVTALDTGGVTAIIELLTVYHLDIAGGYWQAGSDAFAGSQDRQTEG